MMASALPWLTLKNVPGIGNLLFKRLIDRLGSPEAVLAAAPQTLAAIDGVSTRLAAAVSRHQLSREARRRYRHAIDNGCRIILQADGDYPELLHQLPDPPPLLWVYGQLTAQLPAVALVGTRRPTRYGIAATQKLAGDLTAHGLAIVSGLARGIDTAAHQATLQAGGITVAVLGSGLQSIYPPENRHLAERIAAGGGAVISEFDPDSGPEAHHFPVRNRIISGLSYGVVVIEAAKRSGSLITARLAAEQNREVFAVPGSIHSHQSYGTHILIKQGAKLVANVTDILEELPPAHGVTVADSAQRPPKQPLPQLSADEMTIAGLLSDTEQHMDAMTRRAGLDAALVGATLLQLELKGVAVRRPGNMYLYNASMEAPPPSGRNQANPAIDRGFS